MPEPLVTVVIPTFRREEMVVEAARSALAQRDVAVEVIVVDDSADGSAEGGFSAIGEPRVRYVRRATPSGGRPALARNEGLALARGKYVHFLDDDDLLEEEALSAMVGALEAAPSAGVAVGTVVPFGDDPAALRHEQAYFQAGARRLRAARSRLALVASMLFDRTPLVNSECTIRRDCARALGGYSAALQVVEDVDFYLRAIRRCGFVFVDRPVVRYRTGTPSLMHSLRDLTVLNDSYREIHAQYRRDQGWLEFGTLRVYERVARALRRAGGRVRARLSADDGPRLAEP
jgi:glycosyltransferase involved in cell wall biosynthesis